MMESSHYSELKWGNVSPPLDATEGDFHASPPRGSRRDNDSTFLPLHAEKTALLVVDVQPEYWSQCPAVQKDFPDFPRNLQATVETCRRQTVAKVIWVRADYRYSHSPWLKQFSRIHGIDDGNPKHSFRAEVPCDPTSQEFQWEEFATPIGGEVLIPKSSWSSTSNTALMNVLRASGVDTVLVCGLITSVCVQHSAFGLFEQGYRTILVTDACADRGKARHEAALALYGDYMYELITSDDLQSSSSPRRLQEARPLWALTPSPNQGTTEASGGRYMYSTMLSSQLPPPSVTLSTSTSTSSLTSAMSNVNLDFNATSQE